MPVQNLIHTFREHANELFYANVGGDGTYSGWVTDFNFQVNGSDTNFNLDLFQDEDLFLLFVLAVVWSRTGQWENSAYFVAFLKCNERSSPLQWRDDQFVQQEYEVRQNSSLVASGQITGLQPRRNISFRKDIFASVEVLANNWESIRDTLMNCGITGDYLPFISELRGIEGLGVGTNRMLIKIPLILRELRCQNVLPDIPGQFCCVPDARVVRAAINLGLNIRTPNSRSLMDTSTTIYELFGDLYDLPLFAYEDLQQHMAA